MSLASTILLYAVYAKFVVPIIEGPPNVIKPRIVAPNVEPSSIQFDKSRLTRLLPENAWEHGECKTLLTPQGTILFKNFERVGGNFIDVFPFTLIATDFTKPDGDSTSDDKPLTVLRCIRRARLKFDKSIAEAFAGKAKMDSAELVGQVEIFRPASFPGGNDALTITTSNVQIEKQKIFTIEQVFFGYGKSRGSGRNLSIELAHESNVNEISGDFSSIRGIRRIELAYVDQLRFEPSNNELRPIRGSQPGKSGQVIKSPLSNLDSPLNVRCEGPFVFDLDLRTATFRENVVVELENEYRDQIQCDMLEMVFVRQPQSNPSPLKPNAGQNLGDLTLHKIAAKGKPAIVFSPIRESKVECGVLNYFAAIQRILVESSSEYPKPIIVVSPDYHVVAQHLSYQMMDDGSLGLVDALGPGKILQVANPEQKELYLQWQEKLAVRPQGNQKVFSILGGTKIRYDRTTNIESGRLDVWLNQSRVPKLDASGELKQAWDYQPSKLVAHENVVIQSEELDGEANRLVAVWDNPPQQPIGRLQHKRSVDVADHPGGMLVSRRPTFSNPEEPWVEVTRDSSYHVAARTDRSVTRASFQELQDPESPTNKKFSFRGDSVDMKLVQLPDKTELRELFVKGNVKIQEQFSPDSTDQPLSVTGQTLRLVPQADKMVRMLVGGTATSFASVIAKDIKLVGQTIHLDQSANKLWVEGAGQMMLQNKSDPNLPQPSDPNRGAIATSSFENVNVNWQGGMIFDGTTIYFERLVKLASRGSNGKGQSVSNTSRCEALSLQLQRSVNFAELNGQQRPDDIEIDKLVFVDRLPTGQNVFQLAKASLPQRGPRPPAMISNQVLGANGEIVEKQEFRVSQATVDSSNETIDAKGPGVLMQYRKGRVTLTSDGTFNASNAGNSSSESTAEKEGIALIRVNFDGSVQASTNHSRLVIRGNVRTLYVPVESFEQVLDPDQLIRLPKDGVKMSCEQLQLDEWSPRNSEKPTKVIVASGNAHVVSSNFEAIANQVRYDEASDMLVIEGSPRSDARLYYSQTPGSPRQPLVAGKILYRISDKYAEAQAVKSINFSK